MNKMTFNPGRVSGTITLPSSKSQAHRALICAALAGDSRVERVDISNDISATVDALKSLGAELEFIPERRLCTVGAPVKRNIDAGEINCRESASALRFLIPIAAALGDRAIFTERGGCRAHYDAVRAAARVARGQACLFAGRQIPAARGFGFAKFGRRL